jgi:hypothetical protein
MQTNFVSFLLFALSIPMLTSASNILYEQWFRTSGDGLPAGLLVLDTPYASVIDVETDAIMEVHALDAAGAALEPVSPSQEAPLRWLLPPRTNFVFSPEGSNPPTPPALTHTINTP